ncbi:MAG: T9SS type A sorting domain-containing protein [Ignavibacteria bacterium]|nr:T9SS type A sorting domain-containing protein [Ignavibacteria bacterium]
MKSLLIPFVSLSLLGFAEAQDLNWERTSGPPSGKVLALAISGTNIFAGASGGGVFLSTNNGTTWIAVNTGLTNLDAGALAVSGTNLFAGTSGGVFLSTNNGTSWTAANNGLTNTNVLALAVSGSNIFAGTFGGVFLSTNNGTSWTAVNTGLTNTIIYALAVSGSNIFAGTYGGGVFRSTNNGTSWTATSSGLTNLYVQAFAVSGTNMFAGTSGGGAVFLSTNNGTSWTAVNTGLTNINVFALAVSGANTFAGTEFGGVNLSMNNGKSWTAVNNGLTNMNVRALAVSGANIFAGTWGDGVFRSSLPASLLPSIPEQEPNNTAGQANQIALGDIVAGSFSVPGDVDYFKLNLAALDTIDLLGSNAAGSTIDAYLKLYDASGNLLEESDDFLSTEASRIICVIPSGGTYYIRYACHPTGGEYPNAVGKKSGAHSNDLSELESVTLLQKSVPALSDTGSYRLIVRRFRPSAPQVRTSGGYNIFHNSAAFDGDFYPNGLPTALTVEYGTTTGYGSMRLLATALDIFGQYCSDELQSLSPNTEYHYRLVATNSLGRSETANESFTTPPAPDGWVRVRTGTTPLLRNVAFANVSLGMAVGGDGLILKTTDGGSSWTPLTSNTYEYLRGIALASPSVALAVGNSGTILRTTDGGTTWISRASGTTLELTDACFSDANTSVVVGNGGSMLRTTDGGVSWNSINSGTTQNFRGVDFGNPSIGIAVGASGTILRTTDGGKSWTLVTSPVPDFLYKVYMVNERVGFVAGAAGILLKTTDGGSSWVRLTSGTDAMLIGISFSDERNGITVGFDHRLLRTKDGGATWANEESGTWNDLYGAVFAGTSAIAVGDHATVLRKDMGPGAAISVQVLSPNGGEFWNEDLGHRIRWQASESSGKTISRIQILYSVDNGAHYSVIFDSVANTGSRIWATPRTPTKDARVRVVAYTPDGASAWDESDAPFTIVDVATYVHHTGVLAHTVRNDGFTGSGGGTYDPAEPSLEFPPGSKRHYLYLGQLMVGAVTASGDTMANLAYSDEFLPVASIDTRRFPSVSYSGFRFLMKQALGLQIDQTTYSVMNESYLLMGYEISNKGIFKFSNIYVGFYCDYDLNDAAKNLSGYDSANRLGYVFDPSGGWGGYAGIRVLSHTSSTFRRWSATVQPEPRNPGDFYRSMAKLGSDDPSADQPADYRVLQCVGPVTLAPGESVAFVVAVAVGEGLSGLRNAVDQAQKFHDMLVSPAPGVITDPASNVTSSSARLNATVDTRGLSTTVVFEYGTSTSYGKQVTAAGSPFTAADAITVSADVTGLTGSTTYHYRVVATNSAGTTPGRDQSFVTLASGTIAVTSTPTVWATGFAYPVTWTSNNVAGTVTIRLSTNGGASYTTIGEFANTGSASVTVPTSASPSTNCKLRISSTLNSAVFGESGTFTIVSGTRPTSIQLSNTVSFPSQPTASTAYRLVSFPGDVSSLRLNQILSGTSPYDWRVFRDNGNSSNFLVEFAGTSTLTVGEGYWMINKGSFTLSRSVPIVTLSSDASASIPLHSGWNIIGNPFEKSVTWTAVLAANGISPSVSTRILDYNGSYTSSNSLDPYKGYYYFNAAGASSLRIPYPFGTKMESPFQLPPVDWQLKVSYASDINEDPENFVGVAPAATEGFDMLESYKPPLFMDQAFVYFERPEWNQEYSYFSGDYRPSLGDGQVWDFVVRNPRKSTGTLKFSGVEQVPSDYAIRLVNLSNARPVDLREQNEYSYRTTDVITRFKLIIGKQQFVDRALVDVVPESFELLQNYPNPFNAGTTILFRVPRESRVQLDIVSMLGQKVKTLVEDWLGAGTHSVTWDGADAEGRPVASGVYFYRLSSDGQRVQTKKLTVLK